MQDSDLTEKYDRTPQSEQSDDNILISGNILEAENHLRVAGNVARLEAASQLYDHN